jgi:hypothetical protein
MVPNNMTLSFRYFFPLSNELFSFIPGQDIPAFVADMRWIRFKRSEQSLPGRAHERLWQGGMRWERSPGQQKEMYSLILAELEHVSQIFQDLF